ncbi:hypothetical protein PMAYCL1PPCAC_02345, partial [Pristionchus mayeri]
IQKLEMSCYLLNEWKRRAGGPQDPTAFMRTLDSERASLKEKEVIVKAFDDWDVLTPTWFEVADYLPAIERLHDNKDFPERLRAALLASKVAYCLGDYKGALTLALSAGELFSLTPREGSAVVGQQDEQYVNRIIEEALDTYKTAKRNGAAIDARLEALINRLFERNLKKKDLRYVIGLAIDTRRVDMIETAIKAADDQSVLLTETVASVLEGQIDTGLRHQILSLLLKMFCELEQPDFVNVCQCLIKLEKPADVADIIDKLISQDMKTDGALLAYQIAFDLYENASQQFVKKILAAMAKIDNELPGSSAASPVPPATPTNPSPTSDSPSPPANTGLMPVPQAEQLSQTAARPVTPVPENPKSIVFRRIRGILRGEETIRHHMQFLIKNNHTDMLVLKEMKDCVRTAMAHNATLLANGLMHLGTTCDDFLRENLEWISKATNWNKFNAVATLGMIHRGHEAAALKLLDPYLPKAEADQFGFKEGGSLYAYGMIHAHHGNATVTKYLRDQLSSAQTAAVRHGACLGLGLATMASHDDEVYAHLREILNMDDAVSGEAAGTAMGLTMVGSLNANAFEEMVQYITETSHDKIQRGLRTGIALLGYGRQEEAEQWVTRLLEAKSCAVMRQAGVCLLAMAYAGTGNASVVKRLLAKVASDPNNDVKRMAVIAIGFLLSNDPEQCLAYTGMLLEHFNGHVRYGAAMALGIACAGSGYKEAISVLEPLLQAKDNFVRQGALIALSFIYIQQTEASCPKVAEFRKTLTKVITEKGEDSMTKFGAILAQGIIDAGGRNVTVALHNRNGHADMGGMVGMFVFLQYWYWHSFVHCLALAFKPTALIALNRDLAMPKMEFRSNQKASLFAYPPALEEKKKEEHEKVETAVLSITNKKRAALRKKEAEKKEEKMEV